MWAVLGGEETEDPSREGESPGLVEALPPPATADAPLGREVDEGDSLNPGDNVADPLLDERVLRVQRSFSQRISELVQSPHALHPLAHRSIFVQLTGLLTTDRAAQEHELLCRAIELF